MSRTILPLPQPTRLPRRRRAASPASGSLLNRAAAKQNKLPSESRARLALSFRQSFQRVALGIRRCVGAARSHWQLINDGGIEVKQAIVYSISAGLLGVTLALAGCSQPEMATTATTPTATPTVATPAPTAEAAKSGNLQKAAEDLEKALSELQEKNYRGSLDWLNGAHKEVTGTLNNLNAPAPVKTSVEQANAEIEKIKALVEKKDPAAEKSLNAAIAQVTKLAERVQSLNTEAAKGAAEKSVPKKQ
jgi:hypothetical protein